MDRRYTVKLANWSGSTEPALLPKGDSRKAASNMDRELPGLPARERIVVAFLLGAGANVMDMAGPWEVFQDTKVGDRLPFELVTVAPDRAPLRMSGGLHVVPRFSVDDAPDPNVIVVPAQAAHDASIEWLQRASTRADVTMSVCTGAFHLARAGLLDGIEATTHHQFWDRFENEFPHLRLLRGPRFVDSGSIATAGGLTSGVDLALRIVARYFGLDVAATTARYMEHEGQAWAPPASVPDSNSDSCNEVHS